MKNAGEKAAQATEFNTIAAERQLLQRAAAEIEKARDAEKTAIISGAYVDYWSNKKNILFFPANKHTDNIWYGFMIYSTISVREVLCQYYINDTTNAFSYTDNTFQIESGSVRIINNKTIPAYPSSTGTFDFESVDGTLSWVQRVIDSVPTANSDNPVKSGGIKTALDAKADASTTYTKTEVDTALLNKANSSDVYTKTAADSLLSAKANASDYEGLVYDITTILEDITGDHTSYTVTVTVTNGTATTLTSMNHGESKTVTITPSAGYELPESVTVTGATASYDTSTGIVSLSHATGNVTVTATCPAESVSE